MKMMLALGTSGPIRAVPSIAGNSRRGPMGVCVPQFRYQYLHLVLHIKKTKSELELWWLRAGLSDRRKR